MHFKFATLMAAVATLVGLTTAAAAAPASAATLSTCQQTGPFNLYSNHHGTRYYLAAPDNIIPGSSHPELKVFPGNAANDTASWALCDGPGGAVTIEYVHNGVIYGLSNDPGDHNRVDIEDVSPSGPNASMLWSQWRKNPYTFQNRDTGLYLRVSNQGYGMYYPVVAGVSKTAWIETTVGT
jgi:hypothetical protein